MQKKPPGIYVTYNSHVSIKKNKSLGSNFYKLFVEKNIFIFDGVIVFV